MIAAPPPQQAGLSWFRYKNVSDEGLEVVIEVIQMQLRETHIGGRFPVRWRSELIPLDQLPTGRWYGVLRNAR